jgi:hypothetical protein
LEAATDPAHPKKWPGSPRTQPKILTIKDLEMTEELQLANTKRIL